jgi:hypothetical protein
MKIQEQARGSNFERDLVRVDAKQRHPKTLRC